MTSKHSKGYKNLHATHNWKTHELKILVDIPTLEKRRLELKLGLLFIICFSPQGPLVSSTRSTHSPTLTHACILLCRIQSHVGTQEFVNAKLRHHIYYFILRFFSSSPCHRYSFFFWVHSYTAKCVHFVCCGQK